MSPTNGGQKNLKEDKVDELDDIPLEDTNQTTGNEKEVEDSRRYCTEFNEASCNAKTRKVRKKIHRSFFKLGRFIQKYYIGCLVFFGVGLGLPCINIKYLGFEDDITNMWITSEGNLKEEMEYTRNQIHRKGFGEEEGIFHETLIQVVKNPNDNILSRELLNEHFQMLRDITLLQVRDEYNVVWNLSDFCAKFEVPSFFGVNQRMEKIISKLSPCLIMTPLDCFYEGSFIASPVPDKAFDYRRNRPKELLDIYLSNSFYYSKVSLKIKEFFNQTGIDDGYMNKPRLFDKNCESKSTTKNCSIDQKDIGSVLKDGCFGIAKDFMHWPQDLIISGVETNTSGSIVKAKALQSVISIKSVTDFYKSVKLSKSSEIPGFSIEIAAKVMNLWRKEFTALIKRRAKSHYSKSHMVAFSTISFENMLEKYLAVDWKKLLLSFLLMIAYAVLTLKRFFQAVYSYGFIGIAAVTLVCVSVILGLAIANLKISVVTTQVLPFLALGLGINNMFLLIRTYVYICDSGKVNDKDIVGMCLGECGLSITTTSITNIVAFMMASFVPIPTIKEFAYKAAIIVGVSWFSIIFVFTAILALDIERQKGRNYDILFCFRVDEDEDDIDDFSERRNEIRINVKETDSTPEISAIVPLPISASELFTVQPKSNFISNKSTSTPISSKKDELNKNDLANSKRKFNVDPLKEKEKENTNKKNSSSWKQFIEKLSLTYFVLNYFGAWIIKIKVKIFVMLLFGGHMALATYGASLVQQGLDISELIPKDLEEHMFMEYRQKYFPYYKIYMATRDNKDGSMFDYAHNQELLMKYYERISKVNHVTSPMYSGKPGEFWLPIYRNWLLEIEAKLREEWNVTISHVCVPNCLNASLEAKLAYRLLKVFSKIKPSMADKIFSEHLVNEVGIIEPRIFYHGLSVWYYNDYLGVVKSSVLLRPKPRQPIIRYTDHIDKAFMASPKLMLIPFEVNDMKDTTTIIQLISDIREICQEFTDKGLTSYPIGIPFTYWEQFTNLSQYLKIALAVVIGACFVFLSLTLMCFKAAFIVVFFLAVNVFELYGMMGFLGIKLNAIPVVVLALSVGMATEFTVHSMLAFINTCGSRDDRTRGALEITFAPMVDTTISTLIVIGFFSTSSFDYVVKYFFHLLLCLVLILFVNGVLVFPVFLSFCGPCAEGATVAIGPSIVPKFRIPRSPTNKPHKSNKKSNNDSAKLKRRPPPLTTIAEESESITSRKTASNFNNNKPRPETPFARSNTARDVIVESIDDYDITGCYGDDESWNRPSLHVVEAKTPSCIRKNSPKANIVRGSPLASSNRCGENLSHFSRGINSSPAIVHRGNPAMKTLEREHTKHCFANKLNNNSWKRGSEQKQRKITNTGISRNTRSNNKNNCRSCGNNNSRYSNCHEQPAGQVLHMETLPTQKFKANVSIEFESHSLITNPRDFIIDSSNLPNVD